MKKRIAIILIALCSIIPSFAQKGEKTLGIMGGYNTETKSALAGIYFQYRFTKYFRLSPDIEFLFKKNGLSSFQFNGNAHFPIKLDSKLNFYPLVGISYQDWRRSEDGETFSFNRFGANAGAGFEFYATPTLKITVEGKYSWIKTYPNAGFTARIGYIF